MGSRAVGAGPIGGSGDAPERALEGGMDPAREVCSGIGATEPCRETGATEPLRDRGVVGPGWESRTTDPALESGTVDPALDLATDPALGTTSEPETRGPEAETDADLDLDLERVTRVVGGSTIVVGASGGNGRPTLCWSTGARGPCSPVTIHSELGENAPVEASKSSTMLMSARASSSTLASCLLSTPCSLCLLARGADSSSSSRTPNAGALLTLLFPLTPCKVASSLFPESSEGGNSNLGVNIGKLRPFVVGVAGMSIAGRAADMVGSAGGAVGRVCE